MSAIIASSLTKKYGGLTAVDNLSVTIPEGELFALLGVNGAGKTTAVKMLSCLIKPSGGNAIILRQSVLDNPAAIKKNTNISPQETAVAPNLTVLENLKLIAMIYGQDRRTAKRNATETAWQFGLDGFITQKAKYLSGGMQRRLSIAMSMISEPKILFLDEPTLGLDVMARRELWAKIKAMKGSTTIILTTHYMEEAEALADRVGIMSKGRLLAVGTLTQLFERTKTKKLEDAFVAVAGGAAKASKFPAGGEEPAPALLSH